MLDWVGANFWWLGPLAIVLAYAASYTGNPHKPPKHRR